MEQLLRDVRIALRSLRRTPLVHALAALSLALGIAATTSIFSALDAFLLRPLPYPDADALVRVWSANPGRGWARDPMSVADYLDYRAGSRTTELAAFAGGSMNIAGSDGADRVLGNRVTANLFGVVGLKPVLGRSFLPEEERAGGARVVVISSELWQRRFGGERSALGATLLLDGEAHEVIGILAPGDYFPDRRAEIWTPLRLDDDGADRSRRWLQVVGRLRAPATVEGARSELVALGAALERAHPEVNRGTTVHVEDLAHATFNSAFRTAATICTVAVVFVLLIACANVANLLLARAAAREREIALRHVLGAGRARVIRQLLTESLLLALTGGALGVLLSVWGIRGLVSIMPDGLPMVDRVSLDGRALVFTAAVSVAAGLLFGLAPALHATRPDLGLTLREAGPRGATTGVRGGRLRSGFVVAQISLALVLMVCAGLLIRSYRQVASADLALAVDGVMTARVALPASQYDTLRLLAFQAQLYERLHAHPGVEHVALGTSVPLTGGGGVWYLPEGLPPLPDAERPVAQYRTASPEYFDAFGIPLLQGRTFRAADHGDAPRVVVVNQSLAQRHWPGENPIGKRIEVGSVAHEVVGVAADYAEWGPATPPPAMLFMPVTQRPTSALAVAIRSRLPQAEAAALLRATIAALDPALPLYQVQSMAEVVGASYEQDRVLSRLLSLFAAMALVLALLGVYGVMAYGVSLRTREFGVRMAIGARFPDILRMVMRQGLRLGLVGIAIGVLVAAAAARFLAMFLYGVTPHDPLTFTVVALALLGAALLASCIPALRAGRVHPTQALRAD